MSLGYCEFGRTADIYLYFRFFWGLISLLHPTPRTFHVIMYKLHHCRSLFSKLDEQESFDKGIFLPRAHVALTNDPH